MAGGSGQVWGGAGETCLSRTRESSWEWGGGENRRMRMNRQRDRQTDRCKTEPQATERWAEWPESPTDTSERMSAEDGGGKRNCRKCRTDAEGQPQSGGPEGQRAGQKPRRKDCGEIKTRSRRGQWLRGWSGGALGAVCGQPEGWRAGDEGKAGGRGCARGMVS